MVGAFTTAEVAQDMGTSQQTVIKLIEKSAFPGAYRLGRNWRIPSRDLKRYKESHSCSQKESDNGGP